MSRVLAVLPLIATLSCFSEATGGESNASGVETTTSDATSTVTATATESTGLPESSGGEQDSSTAASSEVSTAESVGESSGSDSSGSTGTGADDQPCAMIEDCDEGEWCDWTLSPQYLCKPIYDGAHCDENCPPGDRIVADQNGQPYCVCAPHCDDADDCGDEYTTCNPFGKEQRCFIDCLVVPCTGGTPGLACPPAPVPGSDPPAEVFMCMWQDEP